MIYAGGIRIIGTERARAQSRDFNIYSEFNKVEERERGEL